MMKNTKKYWKIYFLLSFLICSSILLHGYEYGSLYGIVDSTYYEIGRNSSITRFFFWWNDNASFGELYSLFFPRSLEVFFYWLIRLIVGDIYNANFLKIFLLNISIPISTFLVLGSFINKEDKKRLFVVFLLSIISITNIYFLQSNYSLIFQFRFPYIITCLIIFSLNEYLRSRRKIFLIFLMVTLILSNATWVTFPFWLPNLGFILLYVLLLWITKKISFKEMLLFYLFYGLTNLPSLGSILFTYLNTSVENSEAYRYANDVFKGANSNSILSHITSFIGGYNWGKNWGWVSSQVYPFSSLFDGVNFLVITRYFLFIVFIAVVLNYQKSNINKFIFFFILLSIFFIASYNPPLGKIFTYVYDNFALMKIFRESHNKFYPILLLSIFIFITINIKVNKRAYYVIVSLLIINITSFVYVIRIHTCYSREAFFKIPPEYFEISDSVYGQDRVLIIPSHAMNQLFSFGLYGKNPLDYLIDNPVVNISWVLESNYNRKATLDVLNQFNPDKLTSFFLLREGKPSYDIDILKRYGIKYLFLDSNVIGNPAFTSEDFKLLSEKFSDNEHYNLISESGSLTLYEVVGAEDSYFDTDLVSYTSINPTKYIVEMTAEDDKEELIFKQSYDKNWKMYPIDSETNIDQIKNNFLNDILLITKKDVQSENHISNDYYLNQWNIDLESYKEETGVNYVINNQDGSKTIKFILYYKPQSYLYITLIISGLSFVSALGYLIFMPIKKRGPVNVVE